MFKIVLFSRLSGLKRVVGTAASKGSSLSAYFQHMFILLQTCRLPATPASAGAKFPASGANSPLGSVVWTYKRIALSQPFPEGANCMTLPLLHQSLPPLPMFFGQIL